MSKQNTLNAQLPNVVSLFPKVNDRRQTPWGSMKTIFGEQIWYANISADIDDLEVIENAKKIIDAYRLPKVGSKARFGDGLKGAKHSSRVIGSKFQH